MLHVNKQLGMMLIELMISIALGLSIFSLLLSLYLVNYRAYQAQLDLQNLQSRAFNTIHILTKAIKKAGWIGCRQITRDFAVSSHLPYTLTAYNRLTGKDHAIQISNLSEAVNYLQMDAQHASILFLDQIVLFTPGEIGMIADCFHAEMFQVKSVSQHKKNQIVILTQPLQFNFKKGSEAGKLEINEYFFDPARHGLYIRNKYNNKKSELVTHIDDIKIQYSVLKNNVLIDESFERITDWSLVKGVAMTLTFNIFKTKKHWYAYAAL